MLMRLRKSFILTMFPIAVFGSFLAGETEPLYAASEPIKVVATQTLFADLLREVGGDRVEVKSVASPKFNVHFYPPKPSDVRNLQKADLYVFAGLDLEAWSDPLVEAAGKPEFFRGGERSVDLSIGIRLLRAPMGPVSRSQGDIHLFGNPHYHMDPRNVRIMAQTIAEKLKNLDPANASAYEENARAFLGRLDSKMAEWKALCSHCAGQEIISYHDDVVYLADFLGLKDEQYLEPMPGIPPTPKHLEYLEGYAKEKQVKAVVMPTYFPGEAAQRLAGRVGVKVATICQNIGELPGTADIFSFFDYNVKQMSEALK